MSTAPKPTPEEMRTYALRYGLDKLAPEHLARMAELAPYVSDLGSTLPRPACKADAPAPIGPSLHR